MAYKLVSMVLVFAFIAAPAVLTTLTPEQEKAAIADGRSLVSDPVRFMGGLGLYSRFLYDLDGKEGTAYLFVGTKYGLIRARAALAERDKGEVGKDYIEKVRAQDRFYISFFAREFKPVLILLRQEDTVIKAGEGFGDVDPGLASALMTKSFPYGATDFTKPAEVEVYNADGKSIVFELDLGGYK